MINKTIRTLRLLPTLIILLPNLTAALSPSEYPAFFAEKTVSGIRIDGNVSDWVNTGRIIRDKKNDMKKMNRNRPWKTPLPSDDIRSYGFAMDEKYIYCMFQPQRMPRPGSFHHYRVRICSLKWESLFAVVWYHGKVYIEKYARQPGKGGKTRTIRLSHAGVLLARGDAFEARIPRKNLPGLPANIKVEGSLWHGHKNIIDTAPTRAHREFKAHYTLEVLDRKKHLVRVTAHFWKIPHANVVLRLGPEFLKVENFMAIGTGGSRLPFSRKGNVFQLGNRKNSSFHIRYELRMNQRGEKNWLRGYLCSTYMLTMADWVLMLPKGIAASRYSIELVLPPGWTAVTHWRKKGRIFYETRHYPFLQATIAAGRFEVREKMISGTRERIAVDRNFSIQDREALFNRNFRIFRFIKSLFGTRTPKEHLFVIARSMGKVNQSQAVNEACYSHGEAVRADSLDYAFFQQAHRVFHTYNTFYPNGINEPSIWFREGPNMYYDVIALMKTGARRPMIQLEYYYREYLKGRSKYDTPVAQRSHTGRSNQAYLYYRKGALVAAMLDRAIRKQTKGRRSLADVLKTLYKQYGGWKKVRRKGRKPDSAVTDRVILETVSRIAGQDMSPFFRKYVYGNAHLPIAFYFKDNDKDGLSNIAEELLGTDPDKADTDGDGVSDYREYLAGTDPKNPASRPRQ